MNDQITKPTASVPTSVTSKLEKFVSLSNGEKVLIKKLKAGAYYQAQKYFAEWITGIQKVAPQGKNKEGGEQEIKTEFMASAVDRAGESRLKLVALAVEKTVDEVKDEYYPEDIEKILNTLEELNKFMVNLGNSVAPTGLGAM